MIASLSKVKGLSTFMAVAELLPDLHFRLMLSADMESIQAYLEQSIPKNVELIQHNRISILIYERRT